MSMFSILAVCALNIITDIEYPNSNRTDFAGPAWGDGPNRRMMLERVMRSEHGLLQKMK